MIQPLMQTYQRLPVAFAHGNGIWLYDTAGNEYLDGITGLGVCNLGHRHPAVVEAIREQADALLHTSNLYTIDAQEQLGRALTEVSGMAQVFFANSGAEANEAAIKIARRYSYLKEIENPRIVVMENSFHGRTLATLAATDNPAAQTGFAPLPADFIRVPFNDLDAIRKLAESAHNIVAILLEPIQGEGGIYPADRSFLQGLRGICDEHQWLLMLDEVQCGNGRSGSYFAYQQAGILPDVVTTAKGLANGVPIGACLSSGLARDILTPGTHGSTFGGNPLSCRVGLAVIKTIQEQRLCQRASLLGERMLKAFNQAFSDHPEIVTCRGQGLMLGIELRMPAPDLVARALDQGLLINVTRQRIVRLLPPLILTDEQADLLTQKVISLVLEHLDESYGRTHAAATG